jgi:hypothetical protein
MEKMEALETAKRNVRWLLDHANGSVDMKGLVYWAGRVETLRDEIKATL